MIQRLLRAAALPAAFALAGCAAGTPSTDMATGTPATPRPPEARLQARIDRLEREVATLRNQMETMRPTYERLASVEGDIRALLAQLSQVPGRPEKRQAVSAIPPPAPKPAVPASATRPPSGPKQAPAADPLDPTSGATAFGVHLASYRRAEQVARGWNELQHQLGADIAGLSPRVVGIDFGDGRGTFYRLKAGPLKDRAAAEGLCRKLRAKAMFCEASDFTGTPGGEFWYGR